VFPRDHIAYARRLWPGRHVQLAGTVTRVKATYLRRTPPMGFFELDARVDCAAGWPAAGPGDEDGGDEDADAEALGFWAPLEAEADAGVGFRGGAAGAAGQAAEAGAGGGEGVCGEAAEAGRRAAGEADAGAEEAGPGAREGDGPSADETALVPAEAFEGEQTVR